MHSTQASTSSIPPTSTRAGNQRRSSPRRSRAAATRSCSRRRCTARWATIRTQAGNSRRWIIQECENSLRRLGTDWIDLYQIHRFDEDTDHDETLGALTDLVRAGQGPLHRLVDVPGKRDRHGAVGRRAARPRPLRLRAAAVLAARTRDRGGGAAALRAVRDGRHPVEPAGGRLAERPLAQGPGPRRRARAPGASRSATTSRSRRTSASSTPAEALATAGRGGGNLAHPPGARVRAAASGGHGADHRPAHDGAARQPARRRSTCTSMPRCSIASTRSSRPERRSLAPTPAGLRPRSQTRRAAAAEHRTVGREPHPSRATSVRMRACRQSSELLERAARRPGLGAAPRPARSRRTGRRAREAGRARAARQAVDRLGDLHNRLYAESTRSVLLVLQGMDASGKDGTIRTVFTGVNPQGCRVQSFKVPTVTELAHDYLWRIHNVCPARGEIVIFNRSHYEDVVAVRVRKLARGAGLAAPLRAHPRVREAADRRGNDGRQGLPAPLARRAAQAAAGAARRSGEALEVPGGRPRRSRAVGRLHAGVRGRAARDLDRRRAVVRRPGRPQLVPQPRRRGDPRRRARAARPEAARARPGHREHEDRLGGSGGAARRAPARTRAPASGVSKMLEDPVSNVISKTLRMFGSLQTITSSPPVGRRRFIAPIRTPSAVESMKVAPEKSTSTTARTGVHRLDESVSQLGRRHERRLAADRDADDRVPETRLSRA